MDDSDGVGATLFAGETCPEHEELAVSRTVKEAAIGHILAFSQAERLDPGAVGGIEEVDRLTDSATPVVVHLYGQHRSVANLDPFMAVDHPVLALAVNEGCAVE